jgi:hypothetical protein
MTYIAERYLAGAKEDLRKRHRSHPVKPPEAKHRKVARDVLRHGKPLCDALVAAGYSPTQSKTGMRVVEKSNALRVAFQEEAAKIEADAKKAPLFPTENALEGLIMGRLQSNIVKGKDLAVMSCKLAGSHKKLNLWTVDSGAARTYSRRCRLGHGRSALAGPMFGDWRLTGRKESSGSSTSCARS